MILNARSFFRPCTNVLVEGGGGELDRERGDFALFQWGAFQEAGAWKRRIIVLTLDAVHLPRGSGGGGGRGRGEYSDRVLEIDAPKPLRFWRDARERRGAVDEEGFDQRGGGVGEVVLFGEEFAEDGDAAGDEGGGHACYRCAKEEVRWERSMGERKRTGGSWVELTGATSHHEERVVGIA